MKKQKDYFIIKEELLNLNIFFFMLLLLSCFSIWLVGKLVYIQGRALFFYVFF